MDIIQLLNQLPPPKLMFDPITLALLATTLITAGVGYMNQNKANKENKEYNDKNYQRQRQDALEDFERTNQYNSPVQQMNRLRQAGLNPNLVYGKGADNTATAIRSTQNAPPSNIAPKLDLSGMSDALSKTFQIKNLNAQTDNLETNRNLMIKEGLLKDATTAKILQDTARSKFDLEQAYRIKDAVYEKALLENAQTQAETDFTVANTKVTLNRNDREKLANSANVEHTLQSILRMKADLIKQPLEREKMQQEIDNLIKDGKIKDLDINLRGKGLTPSDPLYIRLLERFFRKGSTVNNSLDHLDKSFENFIK